MVNSRGSMASSLSIPNLGFAFGGHGTTIYIFTPKPFLIVCFVMASGGSD